MAKVSIIQRVLPHYRIPFFEGLAKKLCASDIEFRLIYGQEYPGTVPKTVDISEAWAERVDNRYFRVGSKQVIWQDCLQVTKGSDLIIVEQANALLLNYVLLGRRSLGKCKLAFWGHGRNMQARRRDVLSEWFKSRLVTTVDWWFAYTDMSADLVKACGFPAERITVVQNSIDTEGFQTALDAVTDEQVLLAMRDIGIQGHNIAVFSGGLYADKKLDFLIEACVHIREMICDFHLIVIGSGPDESKIVQASQCYDWIHYVGPKFGAERAIYFRAARMLLMPGLVGLAIIDSFVAETPMFTTDLSIHSPEIAYLDNGINGVIAEHNVKSYARSVVDFLVSPEKEERLRDGCRRSGEMYTLTGFVERYVEGIRQCLNG